MGLYVASPAQGPEIAQGIVPACVQGYHMMGLKPSGLPTLTAAVSVAGEYLAAKTLPCRALGDAATAMVAAHSLDL